MTLLTIAVPTYFRAAKLDRQLDWLDRNLAGKEADCSLVFADNASPDETPLVLARWTDRFRARGLRVENFRNPKNVGPLPNIAKCIRSAEGRFVWTIGDDDDIEEGALGWLVDTLKAAPDLASVVINYRVTGKYNFDRAYAIDADRRDSGARIFETCYSQRPWGLGFMTAQVYRTEYVCDVMDRWPDGVRNYDYQTWVTVSTGLMGDVLITSAPRVTYVTGDNVYVANPSVALRMVADEIEILSRFAQEGLSPTFFRGLARANLWANKGKFLRAAARVSPLHTIATAGRIARYLAA